MKLLADEKALGLMTAQFQDAFQRRASKFQQETAEAMRDLALKYGLDYERVQYVASPDGSQLVPQLLRFPAL